MTEKQNHPNESLKSLDGVAYVLIGVAAALSSSFGVLNGILLFVLLAAFYRFTVRPVVISKFPESYGEYFCSSCSAGVSPDAKACPRCGLSFDVNPKSGPDHPDRSRIPGTGAYGETDPLPLTGTGEPARSKEYRANVVLICCALVTVLMILSVLVIPPFIFEAMINVFMVYTVSVFLVFFDARRIGAGRGESRSIWKKISPAWWLVLMVVLWIVAFPVYLLRRHEIFSKSSDLTSDDDEFSLADRIGSIVIPLGSPFIGTILAFYYAYRRNYFMSAVLFVLMLFCWYISTTIPEGFYLFAE